MAGRDMAGRGVVPALGTKAKNGYTKMSQPDCGSTMSLWLLAEALTLPLTSTPVLHSVELQRDQAIMETILTIRASVGFGGQDHQAFRFFDRTNLLINLVGLAIVSSLSQC